MAYEHHGLIVRGAYGHYNFGDDALMAGVDAILRCVASQVSAPVAFVCQDEPYVRKLVPHANIISTHDACRITTDVLLYGGGTQFYSFPRTAGRPRSAVLRTLWGISPVLYIHLRAAYRMLGRQRLGPSLSPERTMALGIGVGPFVDGSIEERLTRSLFRGMSFVAVRDEASVRQCHQWRVRRVKQYCDICCWRPFYATLLPSQSLRQSVQRVLIIVRDWTHDDVGIGYRDSVLRLRQRLHGQGIESTFCLFKGHHDVAWDHFLHTSGAPLLSWNPEHMTLSEFCAQIAEFDLFITARYHGAIFATLLEKPTICIDIEPKLSSVAEDIGLKDLVWSPPFDERECMELVARVQENMIEYVSRVRMAKARLTDMAEEMVSAFRQEIVQGSET